MYNNPYNPYLNNYNTYTQNYVNQQYPQQNYNQVPPPQMQQPQQQTNAIITNKIYVSGIEEVKSKIQPPNSDMYYIDNDKPLLYEKIVDGTGKFTLQTFQKIDYVENQKKEELQAKEIDMSVYVLKSDFDALQAQINALENAINEMKNKKADNFVITEVKK